MIRFAREYGVRSILQQPVAKSSHMDIPTEMAAQSEAQLIENESFSIMQRLVA